MPADDPSPLPPVPRAPLPGPPALRPPRPPPPGPVVWLAFLFGPPVLLTVGCVLLQLLTVRREMDSGLAAAGMVGLVTGLVLGAVGVGGLALATRLFTTPVGRIVGGIALAVALLVGLAGVAFAGCMCVAVSLKNR